MDTRVLYQWSTGAQLVSVLMIALFYAIVARSVKRAEVAWWAQGWWCNFAALTVTLGYWVWDPTGLLAVLMRATYVAGKVAYALLLVQGAWALRRSAARWLSPRALALCVALAFVIAAAVLRSLNLVGVGTQAAMGLLFTWCGLMLLRHGPDIPMWLGTGFLVRGVLSLVEAGGYAAAALPAGTFSTYAMAWIESLLAVHSAVDLAAEWLLALGGVLSITHRGQLELQRTNADLLTAQEELRRIADRDPLTGLANRRALPEAYRSVFDTGAAIAFFDLDGFKAINDRLGHAEGDATLVRFATALRGAFRPTDTIVRYGGDEFVVIAGCMTKVMAEERVARMRANAALPFSVGIAELAPGGHAELALKAADENMYASKATAP